MAVKNKINLNIRIRYSAQAGERIVAAPSKQLGDIAYLIFEDIVAAAAAEDARDLEYLSKSIYKILYDELTRLSKAMLGDTGSGIIDGPGSLRGNLDVGLKDGVGAAAARLAVGRTAFSFSYPWVERSEKYLFAKAKAGKPDQWFVYDGILKGFLGDPEKLLAALGPIRVVFTPVNKKVDAAGQTRHAAGSEQGGRFVEPFKGAGRVTSASAPGLQGLTIVTGRIKVNVFEAITPAMLPGLLSGNPADFQPGRYSGLFNQLPAEISRRLYRLPNRVTIEPYLSWYLTKAVPYAVIRRLGQLRRTR